MFARDKISDNAHIESDAVDLVKDFKTGDSNRIIKIMIRKDFNFGFGPEESDGDDEGMGWDTVFLRSTSELLI